ncbi:MAG TPA: AAA family ATPase [Ignavibacteria bacterium]|nr:AAA family ATPase [Ignavibacteria bacterium]
MSRLDLKYRPKKFSEVLGNGGVKKLLLKRSNDDTLIDQSMMFGGPKGCGKTSMARIVARSILCINKTDGDPCGICDICASIMNDVCDSVQELDAASQGTVDRVRSMVQDSDYGTLDGNDHHIYIIDEAQRLSKAAQDALLKVIESRKIIVILCTTEPQHIKGPIRDRVEEYAIYPPLIEDLVVRLESVCDIESIMYEHDAILALINITEKTPRSCLIALDSLDTIGGVTLENVQSYFRFDSYSFVSKFLSLLDKDTLSAFYILDDLSNVESPTWIRDAIILAIVSEFRSEIGATSTFPVKTNFFSIRGREWTNLANKLGCIDRPSMASIESILLSSIPHDAEQSKNDAEKIESIGTSTIGFSNINIYKSNIKTKYDSTINKIENGNNDDDVKQIQVDGVTFSHDESLTTLDNRIIPKEKKCVNISTDLLMVKLDNSRAPITEKEFVSGFINRIKQCK